MEFVHKALSPETAMAIKKIGKEQATVREHQEALAAAKERLPACVVVTGECEFLRSRAVADFRDAWLTRYSGGDVVTLRAAGEARPASLVDIVGELSGGSLFAREKLVVVRQSERILFPQGGAAAKERDDARERPAAEREKGFLEKLENPVARMWLLIESAQLPKNRTLGKRMAELCVVVPCPQPTPRDVPAWLSARAKELDKRIDHAAMDLLARAHGTDLGVLTAELDKLALYAGDKRDIDAGMASEFLTGSIEFDIFRFTNAVEARDADQALRFARRIATQGTRDQRGKREGAESSSHKVLSMLAGTVQGLLRARVASAMGLDAAAFAANEKLSPWRAGKLQEAAGAFSLRELRLMARYASDQIRRTHDTGGDPLLALELMAVRFTAPRP